MKIITLIITAALLLAIPTMANAATKPKPATVTISPVVMTYAGDSTTAMSNSWLTHIHAPDFTRVPGFAHSGYTTEQVLAVIPPAPDADVLVIMLGINDIHYAHTAEWADIIDRINQIAVKVGAKHTILSAMAPSNINSYIQKESGKIINPREQQTNVNKLIKADAETMGYTYFDSFSGIRSAATGAYHLAEYTADGTHPSTEGYVIVAQTLAPEMQRVANLP